MTTKYKLPSVEEILKLAATEEGRDKIISDFRTETDNLSIEEALAVKKRLDAEVAVLVDRLVEAQDRADNHDSGLMDILYDLESDVISSFGYDGYDGEWVSSNY